MKTITLHTDYSSCFHPWTQNIRIKLKFSKKKNSHFKKQQFVKIESHFIWNDETKKNDMIAKLHNITVKRIHSHSHRAWKPGVLGLHRLWKILINYCEPPRPEKYQGEVNNRSLCRTSLLLNVIWICGHQFLKGKSK